MKAAIYMRGKKYQIKQQEKIIKNIIGVEEFNNADKYVDKGYSGLDKNRPMLDNFLNKAKKYNKIYITSAHILTRTHLYFLWIEKYLKHTETKLIFLDRINLKMKRQKNVEKGSFQHNIPFGYHKENGKMIINKNEAETVKLIFELYSTNHSLYDIYDILIEKNITTRRNYYFRPDIISKILDNEIYIGNYYYNKTSIHYNEKGKKIRIKHPKSEWKTIQNLFPPIVSKEIFNKVKAIKESYKQKGIDINDF